MKKSSIASLIAIIAVALVVWLGNWAAEQPEDEVIRPVMYTVVALSPAGERRTFSGTVEADYEATLSFKVGGMLETRPADVGDDVAADQLLAALDNRDYKVAVQSAEASLSLAQAQHRNAEADYARTRSLYENRNASKNDLDASRANAESREAQVESAQAALDGALLQLSYTEIYSPATCQVASVYLEENENVTPGQPVVRINCGNYSEVVVSIPETVINYIRVNQQVNVRAQAFPGQVFSARVSEVGVARGPSAAYPVRVVLTEENVALRSGMAADVTFDFTDLRYEDTIRVPLVSVSEDRDGNFVYILTLEDERENIWVANRQAVDIAGTSGQGFTIAQGVEPGDYLVTAGVKNINDGQKVTLMGRREE